MQPLSTPIPENDPLLEEQMKMFCSTRGMDCVRVDNDMVVNNPDRRLMSYLKGRIGKRVNFKSASEYRES